MSKNDDYDDIEAMLSTTHANTETIHTRIYDSMNVITSGKKNHPMYEVVSGVLKNEDVLMHPNPLQNFLRLKNIVENNYLVPESESDFFFQSAKIAESYLKEKDAEKVLTIVSKPIHFLTASVGKYAADKTYENHPILETRTMMNLFDIPQDGNASKQALIINTNFPYGGKNIDSKATFSFVPSTEMMLFAYLTSLGVLREGLEIYNFIEARNVQASGIPEHNKLHQIITANNSIERVFTFVNPDSSQIYETDRANRNIDNLNFSPDLRNALNEMMQLIFSEET
jgi:hypothetical protein